MKVLVTGSNGMLGQDLCQILESNGYEVIKANRQNFDITNKNLCENFIKKVKPNILIHGAAYTNVDLAELDFENAKKINVLGTKNIAEIVSLTETNLVYISTDYVFDGTKKSPYLTTDIPNPINNYGITKYQGEEIVKELCKRYYIVRTGWLYGFYGNNFVETMLSLSNKSELKVVNDQTGCPTWTVELSNGLIELIKNKPYGTYHACCSGQASWYEFAKEIFSIQDLNVNLLPCSTSEFPRQAKRPMYSVMYNNELCRDWKVVLREYFFAKKKRGI